MNKNKIILIIVGSIVGFLIVLLILSLNKGENNQVAPVSSAGNFHIWIVGDDKGGFAPLVNEFIVLHPEFQSKTIKVNSFSTYENYYYALTSAIAKDQAPDLFVLNNSESVSIFDDQVKGISSDIINPNDFRKKYKPVFGEDLILQYEVEGETKDILKGVPVGYETLGVFYNRIEVKSTDLANISTLNSVIKKLKQKKPNTVPLAIGNGSTVVSSEDIVTQLFMYEDNVTGISDVDSNKVKQSLSTYFLYGDVNFDNGYDSRFTELKTTGNNNIDLFSRAETSMVIGYPRLIQEIEEKGYKKSLLLASPFPHYYTGAGKTLLNYNYFVISKDTQHLDLANGFLQFLSSDKGAESYLTQYPYYLPALQSLESDMLDNKISPDFYVTLGDFYDHDFELGTFDRGIKTLYDRGLVDILDNASNYISTFNNFNRQIVCKTEKFTNLENIDMNCE